MGSNKKHKDSKKRKHHSRSHTPERVERVERVERKHRHHHKKHHKDKKKEKLKERNGDYEMRYEVFNSEEDEVVLAPPPPKISRPATPPPPAISSRSDQSLSVQETNKLRARLGLKPLDVGDGPGLSHLPEEEQKERKEAAEKIGGVDMGEFVHKPADNIAKKVQAEKIKEKLQERKERRKVEAKLASVKTLGVSDSEDDARTWVQKSRKLDTERLKAEQREKMLDQLDAEFGVGDLVEDEIRDIRRNVYAPKDLRGLQVRHDPSHFQEGRTVVLTLQDKGVLDEDDDVLVNVNMVDDDRYRRNNEVKKQKPNRYDVYNDVEYDEYGDLVEHSVLGKYDEEIDGHKTRSFRLGEDVMEQQRQRVLQTVRQKLGNKVIESLDMPAPQLASEYYTEQEMEVKFKKTKKKFRKIRRKPLKADDLARSAPEVGSVDWLQDMGTKRAASKQQSALAGTGVDGVMDLDLDSMRRISIKPEPHDDDAVDVDDLPPPPDLSNVKFEPDDSEQLDLQLALKKSRKLKQLENREAKQGVAKVAETILNQKLDDGTAGPGGSIVLNSTAEFCRTLGDIPTYGLAGNRDEDAEELMDFERALKEEKYQQDEEGKQRGAWNEVEMDETPVDVLPAEVPILDQEPNVGSGVAGALRLAVSKGYLEKEDKSKPSVSRFAHLQAQNYSIEDKTYCDDDKFGRRERYNGPSSDFKEKDGFKPNVKLDYIDDDGHILNAKEAFRYLSHKFHGKGPGKNKVEKRMKKNEQEGLMKQMSSTDTPLGTLNLLQQKQKETQSAFIVLSGSKQMATISKTKM